MSGPCADDKSETGVVLSAAVVAPRPCLIDGSDVSCTFEISNHQPYEYEATLTIAAIPAAILIDGETTKSYPISVKEGQGPGHPWLFPGKARLNVDRAVDAVPAQAQLIVTLGWSRTEPYHFVNEIRVPLNVSLE